MAQYFRALDAGAQKALQLRLDAIAACARGDMVESAELYKQARGALKLARKNGSLFACYLLFSSYDMGGWGKLSNRDNRDNLFTHLGVGQQTGIRNLCIKFCNARTKPPSVDVGVVRNKMTNGDFTEYEANFAGFMSGIDSNCADMLVCAGSVIGALVKYRLGPFDLKPYITGKSDRILVEYALLGVPNLITVIFMIEADVNLKCANSIRKCDARVHDVLEQIRIRRHSRMYPSLGPMMNYLLGRLWYRVLEDKYYEQEIAYYRTRTSLYRSRAITWMLVARFYGLHKDISRMIGKMVYSARFIWE